VDGEDVNTVGKLDGLAGVHILVHVKEGEDTQPHVRRYRPCCNPINRNSGARHTARVAEGVRVPAHTVLVDEVHEEAEERAQAGKSVEDGEVQRGGGVRLAPGRLGVGGEDAGVEEEPVGEGELRRE
jgi:hypothetical protein